MQISKDPVSTDTKKTAQKSQVENNNINKSNAPVPQKHLKKKCNCVCKCAGKKKPEIDREKENDPDYLGSFNLRQIGSTAEGNKHFASEGVYEFPGYKYLKPIFGLGFEHSDEDFQKYQYFYAIVGAEFISGSIVYEKLRLFIDFSVGVGYKRGIQNTDNFDGLVLASTTMGLRYRINNFSISTGLQIRSSFSGFFAAVSYTY